ncbi:transposase family protein [Streptomyces sp. Cmuel-A718b]|uniref:transposase family protein n=1 Tax=Streptomyces sp. Cmuel-A718b TaxID=697328 RepID=UPI00081DC487|nr:transposase family protein [Streptomyces sp. Cmuel-A718b]SCF72153.1 DDE superfamily endonuclease [Streptomyces sp. Cmuel-A718b]
MVTCAATLDVPRHIVVYRSRLLAGHRRRLNTPRGSRALGRFRQAVLVLRWFRERSCVHCLARDAGVSQATGYRYPHEGVEVLAAQAPDLHGVLDRCRGEEMIHVILDGMLVESDRVTGTRDNGNDLWFSQKHKSFGGNIQFLSAPDGTTPWVSDAEPGSTPDITAARLYLLPALYKAAADGMPALADMGYIGAGIGIPVRRRKGKPERALDVDTRTTNALIRDLRARGERAAAALRERWRTFKHITVSPCRIGDITRAALVLNGHWK